MAKEVFEKIFLEDIDPDKYVEEHGLKTVNDEGALRSTIEKVIADNPQSVEDYHNGKEKAIGFLVGQTMKAMKGKANPGMVNQNSERAFVEKEFSYESYGPDEIDECQE